MGRLLSNRAAIPRTGRPGFLARGRSEGAKGTEHSQEERRNGGFSLPYFSQLGAICVPARQTSAFGLLESTYMPCLLLGCPGGLLINFNVPKLIDGVKRLMNPRADGGGHTGGAGPVGPARG